MWSATEGLPARLFLGFPKPRSPLRPCLGSGKFFDPNRQLSDPRSGGVMDRACDHRRCADVSEFTESFDAGGVHIMVYLGNENDLDREERDPLKNGH